MRDLLTAGLTALDLDPAAADKLARYAELLLEKNKVMNLTAITAPRDVATLHLLDCAALAAQVAWVSAAVLVTALGAALYQTADLGIAPYDYLSLGLRDYTPCPYFGCRIFTDALSALLCWLLGGLVGLGTLICAFCLGPFIQFFDRTFSQKVLQYKPNN